MVLDSASRCHVQRGERPREMSGRELLWRVKRANGAPAMSARGTSSRGAPYRGLFAGEVVVSRGLRVASLWIGTYANIRTATAPSVTAGTMFAVRQPKTPLKGGSERYMSASRRARLIDWCC